MERFLGARYRSLVIPLLCFAGIATVTRVALVVANAAEVGSSWPGVALALAVGVVFDLLAGLWVLLPFGLFLLVMRNRWLAGRVWRFVCSATLFAYLYVLLYLAVVEWYFFGEFSARFNTVAVDYLIFPHEVFVNLWDTYPVWQALTVVAIVTIMLFALIRRRFIDSLAQATPLKMRWRLIGVNILLLAVGTLGLNARLARVSANRVVNEIAMNGLYSFAYAAFTNELDYDTYYARLDDHDAFARVRRLLSTDGSRFVAPDDSLSIDRDLRPAGAPRPLNVVIVLEESLGSHFVKSLTPSGPGVTPEFEKLADSGLLFTHIYATGNRTVRGMEAVLAGFPPIPGQSIVRRPGGRHVFSLPSLLKSFGYSTAFIYGGYSYFDNMGDFTLSNGCDRVIDRTDFKKSTFTTIWGVCDEDLFDNSLGILDSLHSLHRPFFSLILTVSNHSPYTFPDGRIPVDPNEHTRENAVRYLDFALGKFLRDAAIHPFFDSTLFVVLGDHGARVYGAQEIPMDSYEIPVLFYAPKIIAPGQRPNLLGSQLDVAPTIMGVLDVPYRSEFYGHDLLSIPREDGRALMSHNRDVALYNGSRMAVLGIQQNVTLWQRDSSDGHFTHLTVDQDSALVNDAISYYQSAHYLYKHHALHPLEQAGVVPMGTLGQR